MSKMALRAATVAALTASAWAQGPTSVFQTPGMPRYGGTGPVGSQDMSQANRFTAGFNPALSFVVDAVADQLDHSGGNPNDGFDMTLRSLELAGQAWVDPHAWAYFVASGADGGTIGIEEAAIHFIDLGGNSTIRAGRFFIDFGKQMQTHVHELRTIERPLVLRTYLGDEIKGNGLQWDDWTGVGDKTALRWSIGAFQSLLPEIPEDFDPSTTAEQIVAGRKDAGKLNFTARVTGFTDAGTNGIFQLGASARLIPDYSFEFAPSGDVKDHLSSSVYGLDATYGWIDDTGLRRWTLGTEFLVDAGDNGSQIIDVGNDGDPTNDTVQVLNRSVTGGFAFADYAWNQYDSVGLQYSSLHLPDASRSHASEIEAYYTHQFSEFHRLRFDVSSFDQDAGQDSVRFAIQYTAFVGAHGHGVNW